MENRGHRPPKIPEGFHELLESLSYDVLKAQPENVLHFCIENLTARLTDSQGRKQIGLAADAAADQSDKMTAGDPDISESGFSCPLSLMHSEQEKPVRRGGVAAESWDPEADRQSTRVVYPKTAEQKQRLIEAAAGILLFRCLEEEDLSELVDAMFKRDVKSGESVIQVGEPGDNFYIIERGTYDVYIQDKGVMRQVVQYVNKGSFGELALMYNTPRAATVTATTEGVLWAISRETFRNIVLGKAFKKRQFYENLLSEVDILKDLSSYERMSLADALCIKNFEVGEVIFKQGDAGSEMYFIEQGSVGIKMFCSESKKEVDLCTLGKAQYFGELALLTKKPRAATATALVKTRLAVLEVESFERILGPCQTLLETKAAEYAKQRNELSPGLTNGRL